jgi:cyclomaltodextrinase / maltogenic alpha-amylase / neopullulanase
MTSITKHGAPRFSRCTVILALLSAGLALFPRGVMLAGDGGVPSWVKNAVWYQIFPDRFRNGDLTNDPTVKDILGAWPHEKLAKWHVSHWTGDWYELQPWEKAGNKGFYFRAQQRRYGGDLQGVLNKLDYLQDLGITAIYFNPIFTSPSLHKYDASTYHHIDPNFGPDPAGDRKLIAGETPDNPATWKWTAADRLFLTLLQKAHDRGMRIIIDGVFHCTGSTFWAFEDVKTKQSASRFKEWYTIRKWNDPATPQDEFDYEGWFNVRELPELREVNSNLAPSPAEYIHSVVKRWMDPDGDGNPSDGIDGWRLDAAEMAPAGFWVDFRKWVKEINPEAYLVGEIWWEDWKNDRMFNAAPWLKGDQFDAVMNYRWAREVVHFFAGDSLAISASEFDRRLAALRADYSEDVDDALLNLLDSHDTDRLASMIVNPGLRYDHMNGLNDNRTYRVRKPTAGEIQIQKLIVLFQMTYPGAPCIYYGDEAGMWGADDPDERKPMLWQDLTYANESHHPFGQSRPNDTNAFNADLHSWYRALIHIRQSSDQLRNGAMGTLLADDKRGVFVFHRSSGGKSVVVLVNNSQTEQTVEVAGIPGANSGKRLLADMPVTVDNGKLKLTLAPMSGEIIE